MSYTILSETIKSAISIKLGDIFKVPTGQVDQQGNPTYTYPYRYKETVTNPRYPNFYIVQVNLSQRPNGLQGSRVLANETLVKRMQLDYLCNVQYRYAEDTELVSSIKQKLDEVGFKLNTEFNTLDLELPVNIYNKNYEKVDNIGQFTFNVTIFAKSEEEIKQVMEKLQISYLG